MDAGDIDGKPDVPNVRGDSAAGARVSIPQPNAARMMPSWYAALDWSEMTGAGYGPGPEKSSAAGKRHLSRVHDTLMVDECNEGTDNEVIMSCGRLLSSSWSEREQRSGLLKHARAQKKFCAIERKSSKWIAIRRLCRRCRLS